MIRAALFATVSLMLASPALAETKIILANNAILDPAKGMVGPRSLLSPTAGSPM